MSDAKADQIREALYDGIMLANQAGETAAPFKRNMEAALALLPALARIGDVDDLDVAWAEAEAALPEGWAIEGIYGDNRDDWTATAWNEPHAEYDRGHGPTPVAALRALAAKLREVGR
jgi:hypothetical protein